MIRAAMQVRSGVGVVASMSASSEGQDVAAVI